MSKNDWKRFKRLIGFPVVKNLKKTNKWRKVKKYFKRYHRSNYIGRQVVARFGQEDVAMRITDAQIVKAGAKKFTINFTAIPIYNE